MSLEFVVITYSFILFFAIYNLISTYQKYQIINTYVCLQVGFILYYILIPLIAQSYIGYFPTKTEGFVAHISKASDQDRLLGIIYTLLAYFTIIFAHNIGVRKEPINNRFKSYEYQSKRDISFNKKLYLMALSIGVITFIIGFVSQIVITQSLGGVSKAISMAEQLRIYGGDNSRIIPQNRLFFITLMVMPLISTFLFLYVLRMRRQFFIQLLFILSVLISIYYLLFNAGRLGILLFAITLFVDFAFRKFKRPFISMILFSIIGLFALGALDNLFFYLSYGYVKESSGGFLSIINEFAFPYLNLLNVYEINEVYDLRLGIDFFTWIINVIPSSLLNLIGLSKVDSGYILITEFYSGKYASGGIPTDLLTLGIRQFGLLGVIVISFIITLLSKQFDKVLFSTHHARHYFITIRVALIFFLIIPYADLDSFVRNRYDMIIIFLFLLFIKREMNSNTTQMRT